MSIFDFLIIGAGIVGMSIARELQKRLPDAKVAVMDKEEGSAKHASGRNSGVLHSGIYYTANSLKARFTRDGNLAWQSFCLERGLRLEMYGKLVVATSHQELQGLSVLEQRAAQNGVEVYRLDPLQAREVEPRVRVHDQALFVPSTSTVDPLELVLALERDFKADGGKVFYNSTFKARKSADNVLTNHGLLKVGYIVNCAGLYADRVAQAFGFGSHYTMLPFKGLYLYADSKALAPRTHIYPVPDMNNPFLGVHLTRTVDGKTKIGPTAIPALWREHYHGLGNFRLNEFVQILGCEMKMFCLGGSGFRRLAWQEVKKQWKSTIIKEADRLMKNVRDMGFRHWGTPGIRAQLLDKRTGNLEMDFVLEGDDKSMHVLNAVSPALTCALPFASYVVEKIFMNQKTH